MAPERPRWVSWSFAAKTTMSALLALTVAFTFNLDQPQWALLTVETLSPLLLVLRGRPRYLFVLLLAGFHLSTWLLLKIHFLPLVVCLLAFLPLDRLADEVRRRLA